MINVIRNKIIIGPGINTEMEKCLLFCNNLWWAEITRALNCLGVWIGMKCGSYINLFKPLLLSLFSVPNRHIHEYSCLFNQSSVFVSLVGAWAKVWNLIFLYSLFHVFYHRAIG